MMKKKKKKKPTTEIEGESERKGPIKHLINVQNGLLCIDNLRVISITSTWSTLSELTTAHVSELNNYLWKLQSILINWRTPNGIKRTRALAHTSTHTQARIPFWHGVGTLRSCEFEKKGVDNVIGNICYYVLSFYYCDEVERFHCAVWNKVSVHLWWCWWFIKCGHIQF